MNSFDLSVTVSAIVEHNNQFLMVEETSGGERVINQPSGHLEDNESLSAAVVREVLEETGLTLRPTAFVGLYRYRQADSGRTWLRVLFTGEIVGTIETAPTDPQILGAMWMSEAQIRAVAHSHRSPQVLKSLDDYLAGQRVPLSFASDIEID